MSRFKFPPPEKPKTVTVDRRIFIQRVGLEYYYFSLSRSTVNQCIEKAGSYADNDDMNYSWSNLVSLIKCIKRSLRD